MDQTFEEAVSCKLKFLFYRLGFSILSLFQLIHGEWKEEKLH